MMKTTGPDPTLIDASPLYQRSTFFLCAIANKLVHSSSSRCRNDHGIGIVEWRCLVNVVQLEGISAAQICELSGMNKAAISKALGKLEAQGMVEKYANSRTQKPRRLQATAEGHRLYEELLPVVEGIEDEITAGLSAEEHDELIRMLKIIYHNACRL